MKPLEIWSPRYSTQECLVLASKVRSSTEVYSIYFSKAKELAGQRFIMRGNEIKSYPVEKTKTGSKLVYAIPMAELERYKQ